jgi:hypothetical protein
MSVKMNMTPVKCDVVWEGWWLLGKKIRDFLFIVYWEL